MKHESDDRLEQFQQAWQHLEAIAKESGMVLARAQPLVSAIGKALASLVEGAQAASTASQRLDAVGWLPHATTPIEALTNEGPALSRAIEQHYRDNWLAAKRQFLERLNRFSIDEEAKATVREALDAHEHGYYRAVVRVLFPEIERVVRDELRDFIREYNEQREKEGLRKDEGQATLRKLAEWLPLGDHETPLAFRLYFKLDEHLFKGGLSTRAMAADPVPNRQGAMHGAVPYSTLQNSINMLIMADYIFHLITTIKSRRPRA